MNIAINQSLFKWIFGIALVALFAKIVSLALLFILPHFGINQEPKYSINLYRNYHVAKAFGVTLKKKKKKVIKKPVYKLTNVKLKALYSENGKGIIVIEEKGKIIFLSTGESFKGYKLIRIYPDKVVFEKNGKHYELKPEEKGLQGKYSTTLEEQMLYNPEEVKFAVLKRDIDRYKKHFNEIWKNISIKEQLDPKTKRLKGFKVVDIKKNSIFAKIGLQKGDIIIGANNKTFTSYSDVLRLYNNIDKYNAIKITILRNNQKKDLEYEIY
ncbi:PDZ domain-containing protein [Nitratiruptor tergarcus]|uniref:General secretion pathway protein C n=1 Tax=Nitratiruptor tergarcus DSM 16512 TaxID=1069081 RepID=A0A1W1WVG7_9BACT|nr:PDZ domain-containing protein [Nitratiruptor tergarcus]SMC10189.1 general secretion pathway protein C [Nitratiruptor tergarcus DSM 16512]